MAPDDDWNSLSDIEASIEILKGQQFENRSVKKRKEQVECLKKLIVENRERLADAVLTDLGRHVTFTNKVLDGCVAACDLILSHLNSWVAPVSRPSVNGNKCQVRYTPRGLVLIVGTWNFPNPLVFKPLASALAAGNTVLVKLSEVCCNTSKLHARLLSEYMDPSIVRVIHGGVAHVSRILQHRFDTIFYTGNPKVGRIIMKAAAEHLTPCILELGGKNPSIVTSDADIKIAACKIVDGRFKNSGQFCVAPDYVLVERSVKDIFVEECIHAIKSFFGENPLASSSYSRIVNERHFNRLKTMLDARDHEGHVAVGFNSEIEGDTNLKLDIENLQISPTIIVDPKQGSLLLNEEIFGPILPVVSVENVDVAVEYVNSRPTPLALYVFSKSKATLDDVINRTKSGGACANDCIVHMLNESLPFGGCGESGFGNYHGEYGFKAFSHEKGCMFVDSEDTGEGRYPPY